MDRWIDKCMYTYPFVKLYQNNKAEINQEKRTNCKQRLGCSNAKKVKQTFLSSKKITMKVIFAEKSDIRLGY